MVVPSTKVTQASVWVQWGSHQNHSEGLLKHRWLGSTPRASDRISNSIPGDADAAGPQTTQ